MCIKMKAMQSVTNNYVFCRGPNNKFSNKVSRALEFSNSFFFYLKIFYEFDAKRIFFVYF